MTEKMEAELYKYGSEIEDMIASDIRQMTETLSAMGGKIGHVREILGALDASVRDKDADIARLTAENAALQSVKEQQARYDKIGLGTADLARLIDIYEAKIAECETLREKLDKEKKDFEVEKQDIIEARKTAETRAKTLNTQVNELTRKKDEYYNSLTKAEDSLKRTLSDLKAAAAREKELDGKLDTANEEMEDLRSKVIELKRNFEQASKKAAADIDRLEAEISAKDKMIKNRNDEIERIKTESGNRQNKDSDDRIDMAKDDKDNIFEEYLLVAVEAFLKLWEAAPGPSRGHKATEFFNQTLNVTWNRDVPAIHDFLEKRKGGVTPK